MTPRQTSAVMPQTKDCPKKGYCERDIFASAKFGNLAHSNRAASRGREENLAGFGSLSERRFQTPDQSRTGCDGIQHAPNGRGRVDSNIIYARVKRRIVALI